MGIKLAIVADGTDEVCFADDGRVSGDVIEEGATRSTFCNQFVDASLIMQ